MPITWKVQQPTYFTYTWGTTGNDSLFGSDASDWMDGGAGNDAVVGLGGNDVLHGGAGNDLVLGGAGNDSVYGDAGDDILMGGSGHNLLDGGDGNDTLVVDVNGGGSFIGGAGIDFLSFTEFGGVSFSLAGDPYWGISWSGIENVRGSKGDDTIWGDDGDNRIEGIGGNDVIYGGAGNDVLVGGDGQDTVYGGDGDDILVAGSGESWLDGGDGDDEFVLKPDAWTAGFIGGEGSDTVSFTDPGFGAEGWGGITFWLKGDVYAHRATWSSIENVRGSTGNDEIDGDAGANRLEGLAGVDNLEGWFGNDTIEGGAGDDALDGGGDDDLLDGGVGADTLVGGEGADTFRFSYWTDGEDYVADFESGVDLVAISGAGFGISDLAEIDFFAGSGVEAGERAALLYDTDTGVLSFDADAAGGVDALMLANFAGVPALSMADFILV